jgi:AP-4 complex subunit epsilon-1
VYLSLLRPLLRCWYRTITEIYPNPQLLASAAEAVAGLIKSSSHNLKYCGLTALAAITR